MKKKARKSRAIRFKKKHLQQQTIQRYTKDTPVLKGHGLTGLQYDRLLDFQKHRCAICGSRNPTNIDHDHNSGRIRGILCSTCNLALGCLEQWLKRAEEYVRNPPAKKIGLNIRDKHHQGLRY